nr:putative ribonuclease H-like domain-containing protein [Tanacetum cinerariifolium]
MNYPPVIVENQPNPSAGIQEHFDADKAGEGNVQQYVLFPLWSSGSKDPQNTDDDTTFEVKEPEFEVHVSPSSSAKTKKHDDNTKRERLKARVLINEVNAASTLVPTVGMMTTLKREAKGKSPVELSTGFRNLSEEFKDFSDHSINEVNAATLEDITYSDDEEDVGAEADFLNLETNITFSPIPTTRVHKDHPVSQIIGDLSSAPQTRSTTRMVKEQEEAYVYQPPGFEDPDYPDKFYIVVKALYGLHQAPKAWYETLANYLLENDFQRGKIDQTLFIKKQKGDILLVQVYVDDIIFGSTNKDLCKDFEKLMKDNVTPPNWAAAKKLIHWN